VKKNVDRLHKAFLKWHAAHPEILEILREKGREKIKLAKKFHLFEIFEECRREGKISCSNDHRTFYGDLLEQDPAIAAWIYPTQPRKFKDEGATHVHRLYNTPVRVIATAIREDTFIQETLFQDLNGQRKVTTTKRFNARYKPTEPELDLYSEFYFIGADL
jgi:hypothetical protein